MPLETYSHCGLALCLLFPGWPHPTARGQPGASLHDKRTIGLRAGLVQVFTRELAALCREWALGRFSRDGNLSRPPTIDNTHDPAKAVAVLAGPNTARNGKPPPVRLALSAIVARAESLWTPHQPISLALGQWSRASQGGAHNPCLCQTVVYPQSLTREMFCPCQGHVGGPLAALRVDPGQQGGDYAAPGTRGGTAALGRVSWGRCKLRTCLVYGWNDPCLGRGADCGVVSRAGPPAGV
jgi:hypothetical protein